MNVLSGASDISFNNTFHGMQAEQMLMMSKQKSRDQSKNEVHMKQRILQRPKPVDIFELDKPRIIEKKDPQ